MDKIEYYKLFIEVEEGSKSAEDAQIELLELLETVKRTTPNVYSGEEMLKCPFGLYEIFWESGGSSLASVGNMSNGDRWIAPTNWTGEITVTGTIKEKINEIDRMVLLYNK